MRTVPVWLIGSEGQSIQVNAFLDDGSDSTYVRDEIVTVLGLETDEQTLRLTTLIDSCIPLKSKKVSQGKHCWGGPVLDIYQPILQLKALHRPEPFRSRRCARHISMYSLRVKSSGDNQLNQEEILAMSKVKKSR